MENTNWLKQKAGSPLFPDLIWSRPENKRFAGKLLIIGGNLHGFAAPAEAYAEASKAGVGSSKVLLPDKLQRSIGRAFPEGEFGPSTQSGSFSQQSLSILLELAEWADGVLLAGDFGRNSETAIVLEKFIDKYKGKLAASGDSLDYFLNAKSQLIGRQQTTLIINLGKLQKLAKNNRPGTPILHNMNLHELVTVLSDWSNMVPASFVTKHADSIIVARGGKASTTPYTQELDWQVKLGAYSSVWQIQQPLKPFEALTTAVYSFSL